MNWHRYYIYTFEKALREECAYQGYLPYWNWAESAVTGLANHPVFDGSDTSLSGNGAKINNQGNVVVQVPGFPAITFPAGSGGGCVTSGPFKDLKVNLGPAGLVVPSNAPDR